MLSPTTTNQSESPRALMPHQFNAVYQMASNHLSSPYGGMALIWDTGTGKTPAAAHLLEHYTLTTELPALVVAPTVVLKQWQAEIAAWCPTTTSLIVQGATPPLRAALWKRTPRVFITNYETLRRDYAVLLSHHPDLSLLVLDEAHRAGANPKTSTFKILRNKVVPHTLKRLILTATPCPNGLENIFGLADLIHPGLLAENYWHFLRVFCKTHPVFRSKVIGYYHEDKILACIKPFFNYIHKEDVLKDLPPLTETPLLFPLSPEEKTIYTKAKNDLLIELKTSPTMTELSIPNALVKMIRLRQVVNNAQMFDPLAPSTKQQRLLDWLEDVMLPTNRTPHKVIIYTSYAETLTRLRSLLAPLYPASVIVGEQTPAERDEEIKKFQRGDTRIIIMTSAGGEGLNLQEADIIMFYDLPLSYSKYIQVLGRAHRKGQLNPVASYSLQAENSIDTWTWRLIKKKKTMAEKITHQDIVELLQS